MVPRTPPASLVNKFYHLFSLPRIVLSVLSGFRCSKPNTVDIELTNRCNLQCKICWFYGEHGVGNKYPGEELSTNEVFSLVDQVSRYKPNIYIGGAEPFLRKDLFEIFDYMKRRGLMVSFTTNGTLLDQRKIENLVSLGIDQVAFSIDGPERLHDQMRGKGIFRQVTSGIKELSDYKKKSRRSTPGIAVNLTVTSALANHLLKAIDSVKEATNDGVDTFRIHHQWYVTRKELSAHRAAIKKYLGCQAPGAASHLMPGGPGIDPRSLADEISLLTTVPKVTSFPELSHHDIVKYYTEDRSMNGRCRAPFARAVVKPNGDLAFCPDEWIDDFILGNVRHERFDDLWNNDKARLFRAVLFRRKSFAGCKRCSWRYSVFNRVSRQKDHYHLTAPREGIEDVSPR